jgi:enterobactin synthetase component F
VLANKARYDEATLRAHVARLSALLTQFAADPALRWANLLSADETAGAGQRYRRGAADDHAQRAGGGAGGENAGCPGAGGCHWQFSYREMRQQVVALARLLRERGVKPGDSVAVALPRSVFLTLALHGRGRRGLAAAGYRLSGRPPADDAGRRPSVAADYLRRSAGPL